MGRITVSGIKNRVKTIASGAIVRLNIAPEPPTFGAAPKRSAGFASWLKRREQMIGSDLARGWKESGTPTETTVRVAVVIHLAVSAPPVQPIVDLLAGIPVSFDLFFTNSSGEPVQFDTSSLVNIGTVSVFDAPDQGRDVLPLVSLVNADLLEPYELVLKLSAQTDVGDLVRSTEHVKAILSAFAEDPYLGILGSASSILGEESWGENRELVVALLQRLQLGIDGRTLRFVSGNNYWIRGFLLQGLRAFEISEWDFESEFGQLDGTMAHAMERTLGLVADEAGFDIADSSVIGVGSSGQSWLRFQPSTDRMRRARVLALYSPEFHSLETATGWVPAGQALWAALAAMRPLFRGHSQPLLPSELGFYDSRQPGVLAAQFALAYEAGLEGFAFNYYWQEGETHDTEPLQVHLAGTGRNPFCLVWQNELPRQIPAASALQFFDSVLPILKDPRYVMVGGKPVLVVGRLDLIEDLAEVLAEWRGRARAGGLAGLTILFLDEGLRSDAAFDALMLQGPDGSITVPQRRDFQATVSGSVVPLGKRFHGTARRYDLLTNHTQRQLFAERATRSFPLVPIAFDNSPKKKGFADILIGANPFTFHRWLDGAALSIADRDSDERVIFLHGWNDWKVSAVLEPSVRFGKTYLLAARSVLWR